jgi:hypothetical protein
MLTNALLPQAVELLARREQQPATHTPTVPRVVRLVLRGGGARANRGAATDVDATTVSLRGLNTLRLQVCPYVGTALCNQIDIHHRPALGHQQLPHTPLSVSRRHGRQVCATRRTYNSSQYERLDAGPLATQFTLTAALNGHHVGRTTWQGTAPSHVRLGCGGAAAVGDVQLAVDRLSVLSGSAACACDSL